MSDAFDEAALMERVDGDVEFLQETIAMLDEDCPALLDQVHAAALCSTGGPWSTARAPT